MRCPAIMTERRRDWGCSFVCSGIVQWPSLRLVPLWLLLFRVMLCCGTVPSRLAYVTMVTTQEYALGAAVLAKSLRAAGADLSIELFCFYDSQAVPEHVADDLERVGWKAFRWVVR